MTFSLAHITDLHLSPPPAIAAVRPKLKQRLSLSSWRRRRHRALRREVCEALIADMVSRRPDHVAVTGDLVNFSFAAEFEDAVGTLATIGPPDRVSVTPGNHDELVKGSAKTRNRLWGPYMSGDGRRPDDPVVFPYLRRRGDVVMIGVSTARPTPIFYASGAVGAAQMQRLDDILRTLRGENVYRILMLHHPPITLPHHRRCGLDDVETLKSVVTTHGVELILHGHRHAMMEHRWDAPDGTIEIVGLPAAASNGERYPLGAYAIHHIEGRGASRRRRCVRYGYDQGVVRVLGEEEKETPPRRAPKGR